MKILKFILLTLIILTTSVIIFLKPTLHKTVKIDTANVTLDEKMLDTNTKEDKIVWNKWHSDLTNKIMETVKIATDDEPLNTVNMVQFNVDSKGNISNMKISATPPEYTKTAQKDFFEAINSLNGDKVLAFPANSKRKVIIFKDMFTTNTKTRLTRPEDFSDYETVKR